MSFCPAASLTFKQLRLRVDGADCAMCRIKDALQATHSFQLGDSADQLTRGMWKDFFSQMDDAIEGRIPWTLVIRDPLANSFIAPRSEDALTDVLPPDPLLTVEDYERSAEEDAEYGIDHLKAHGTGVESAINGLSVVDEGDEEEGETPTVS